MTKIKNRFKVFKRYEEDFWGELYFSRKKSKVTKRVYGAASAHLTRLNPKYLDITKPIPFRKKRLFKNLRGKANIMLKRFLIYFININKINLSKLFKHTKLSKLSFKKSFAFWVESRLDAFLFRINLFFSKLQIKNWIQEKKILVNFIKVYSADFNLKVGDIVSFRKKDKIYLINKFKYYYLNLFNKEKRFKNFKIHKETLYTDIAWKKKKLNLFYNTIFFNNLLKNKLFKHTLLPIEAVYPSADSFYENTHNIYKCMYAYNIDTILKKGFDLLPCMENDDDFVKKEHYIRHFDEEEDNEDNENKKEDSIFEVNPISTTKFSDLFFFFKINNKYNKYFNNIEKKNQQLVLYKYNKLNDSNFLELEYFLSLKKYKTKKINLVQNLKNNYFLNLKKINRFLKRKKRKKNLSSIPFFFPPYIDLNYKLFLFTLWKQPYWYEIPFFTKFDMSIISGMNLK